ncbi:uncharacterized protein LOC132550069 [Ylistrum balloti]|uniref:uncharacterized protein LOC132550069 n=1 Tax=Ylistrum balloti TaxID=509963 RepID=UPI002905AEE1|nr:uncharacterized protein LOC132550069 [Ylistrum balloti]
MQGRTIYRLEPRLKSMSKAEGNFWVPNAAITEHALTRRLGELDKEKTMFQADYRYRQRELQKELRNIRASKPAESTRHSQSRRFSHRQSADPTSLTDMIDRFKRKRTDQEYLQDQLRQRRDSLVSSIGSKQGQSHHLVREDTTDSDIWDVDRPGCPEPPVGTILEDMRTALIIAEQTRNINKATCHKEAGIRRPQESRLKKSYSRDVTYPRGLSHRSSKRRPREGSRAIKGASKRNALDSVSKDKNCEDVKEDKIESDSEGNNTSITDHHIRNEEEAVMFNVMANKPYPNIDDAKMESGPDSGVVAMTDLKDGEKIDPCVEGLSLKRKEKQLTKQDLENDTNIIQRRCSEPVIVGEKLTLNFKRDYIIPEETLPGFKKHVIVRRFSENDKYQCNFIKDLIDDDKSSTDSDKETLEMSESDVIWDDVRRCRYLRGYDPPIMIMPKEEISMFVFGRDENDILELRREKPLGV